MRKIRESAGNAGGENVLTPGDLYNAEFTASLVGGYNREEVDTLLEEAADAYEALIARAQELQEANEALREQLEKFHEMETTLHDALVSSQKFSQTAVEAAKQEAAAIRAEAEVMRERARLEAEALPDALRAEIRLLKEERERFRREMIALIASHRALADAIPAAEETGRHVSAPTDTAREEEPSAKEEKTAGTPFEIDWNYGEPAEEDHES
jgi:cell division initiation protein